MAFIKHAAVPYPVVKDYMPRICDHSSNLCCNSGEMAARRDTIINRG